MSFFYQWVIFSFAPDVQSPSNDISVVIEIEKDKQVSEFFIGQFLFSEIES